MKIAPVKPTITRKDLESVLDSLINDELTTGNILSHFEASLSELLEIKYSLATCSLTSAYHLVFRALDLCDSDEVIIPSFFHQAPLSALSLTGATPVLVDNEKDSLFPSPELIRERITEKTRAIIVGHTFGFHFDINSLEGINIPVIEDISHAIGTEYDDVPAGSKGSFTVASFAPSMIITTGNGGIVMTTNSRHYSVMRDCRGLNDSSLSYEYSMTDFQSAMGLSQLKNLQDFIRRRREIAGIYYNALRITPHKTPLQYSDTGAYQSFPVIFSGPSDRVTRHFKKAGVTIFRPVPVPLHSMLGIKGLDFPNSERMSKKLYILPMYPSLTKKDIESVSKAVSSFI